MSNQNGSETSCESSPKSTRMSYDKNWASAIVFEIISIFVFAIFAQKFEIQNGRHFWQDKFFLKIGMATLQSYPVGQKFRRNRSI